MNYKSIDLGTYFKLKDVKNDIELVEIIFNKDSTKLSVRQLYKLTSKVQFLKEKPLIIIKEYVPRTYQWLDVATDNSFESIAETVLGKDWRSVDVESGVSAIESFKKSLKEVIDSFPNIFKSGRSDSFSKTYGVLHLILQVAEVTKTPLDKVLEWELIKTLNIVSYKIAYNKIQQEIIKQTT